MVVFIFQPMFYCNITIICENIFAGIIWMSNDCGGLSMFLLYFTLSQPCERFAGDTHQLMHE